MARSAAGVVGRWLDTWPRRALAIGLVVKLIVWLASGAAASSTIETIDALATLLLIGTGGYFLVGALVLANRRLLWRVRRKLIISYIFIGVVPAVLIAVFFLLGGLLLFSNFSSYLVQGRFARLTERAAGIAAATAADIQRSNGADLQAILERREQGLADEFEGASIAVSLLEESCGAAGSAARVDARPGPAAAGSWAHVEPPRRIPAWVPCAGFSGMLAYERPGEAVPSAAPPVLVDGQVVRPAHLFARAVAPAESPGSTWAVVVDLPVDSRERRRIRGETGVEVTGIWQLPTGAAPLVGRPQMDRAPAEAGAVDSLPFPSVLLLEVRDWATGQPGRLSVAIQLSVGEIYNRISAAQGSIGERSLGQGLLIALIVIGVLFLVIEAIALVAGLTLARSITRSVHELFLGTERVRRGDFTHKIGVTARDQLGELAQSFNSMTASIEDLLRQAAEKKRLEEELRIAHEIQMSLLPHGPLQMPGISVTALCEPAREVGGDYYDFLPLDDCRLGVLVADVSGKGTSAALYMAELKGLMLSLSRIHTSPRDLLIEANRIIAEHLDARSFITMTYAVVDLGARTMTYARAGHTPLMHLPARSPHPGRTQVLVPGGLVLGLKLDDGHQTFERLLEEQTLPLAPGDVFLLYTDGITEAMNGSDDCFGEQRLGRLLEEHAHLPAEEFRERVLREVAAFVGGTPQHDDMTMILLRIDELPAADMARGDAIPVEEIARLQ